MVTMKQDSRQDSFKKAIFALNDDTRVLILAFLARHEELCVCEIERALGLGHSRLSRHLKILNEGGFVEVRREGTWGHYRVRREITPLCARLLDELIALKLTLPPFEGSAGSEKISSAKQC